MSQTTLQDLIDERDVLRLAHRYAQSLDSGDTATWATLFTKDVEFRSIGKVRGYDEVVGLPAYQLKRYARTWHGVQTQNVVMHGDGTASGETYCIARHIYTEYHNTVGMDAFSLSHDMLLRYADEYRKEADGVWRFSARSLTQDMRAVHHVTLHKGEAAVDAPPHGPRA